MPAYKFGGGGSAYTYAQLEQLWIQAGGPSYMAPLMAAIALAESSGVAQATNTKDNHGTQTSWGLWQISNGTHGMPEPGILDPLTNARAAVAKWRGQGLTAWGTYTSGRYKKFLQAGTGTSVYANPFRKAKPLTPQRVDMGVDYSGGGPIFAPGPGVITEADTAWSGAVGAPYPGTFIAERLSSGPLAGRYIYFAEDIAPAVKQGQKVGTSTVLGTFTGGREIETGFAVGPTAPGETSAAQAGQASTSGDPGAHPTAYGAAWSNILHMLGAPAGVISGKPVGSIPPALARAEAQIGVPGQAGGGGTDPGAGSGSGGGGGLAGWVQAMWAGVMGGADVASGPAADAIRGLEGASDTAQAIAGLTLPFVKFAQAIDWFFVPSHWIRIFAGVGGGILVVGGVWAMTHAGGEIPGPARATEGVSMPRPMALPLGIGMTGLGAILLFVAFHNLPAEVTTFGGFLGFLAAEAQTAAQSPAPAGGAVPATAVAA